MVRRVSCFLIVAALIIIAYAVPAVADGPTPADRVAALKAHLAESQSVLRQYEWLETVVVSIKGDDYSRTEQRCYHNGAGQLLKAPVPQPAKPAKYGLFGKIPEERKEDMRIYMQEAVTLLHQYIPLNPNGIQAVTEDGKLSFNVTDPGKRGELTIRDFLKKGDRVTLDIDLTDNRPLSLKIDSFLDTHTDAVILKVNFGSLYGTATFAREISLADKGKGITITVQNTRYQTMIQ